MVPDIPSIPGPGGLPPRPAARPAQPGPARAAPTPATPARAVEGDQAALAGFADPFADAGEELEGLPPEVADDPASADDLATTDLDWRLGEALVLDFGHAPRRGTLWEVSPAGAVLWADNGRRVTRAQADRMPAAQRAAYYRLQGVEPPPPRPTDA